MFTGLIETLGVIRRVSDSNGIRTIVVAAPFAADVFLGESIAVNGACLTVVEQTGAELTFEAVPETLLKTNLGDLQVGDRVNLERALRVGDRLGGHWVQGHVDGVGRIASRQEESDGQLVWFDCPEELTRQMVSKGSIAIEGVSLTLVEVNRARFSVALIPFTLAQTTLGWKQPGDRVNIETDILGKYALKALEAHVK
jgi:riboflavin synthase